jgi:MYXO-CTERM domain-containing protein
MPWSTARYNPGYSPSARRTRDDRGDWGWLGLLGLAGLFGLMGRQRHDYGDDRVSRGTTTSR